MARIYDVVCKNCGAKLEWCKYDAPSDVCPECGAELTTNSINYGSVWDPDKVIVLGVGFTNLDVEEAVKRIKTERRA